MAPLEKTSKVSIRLGDPRRRSITTMGSARRGEGDWDDSNGRRGKHGRRRDGDGMENRDRDGSERGETMRKDSGGDEPNAQETKDLKGLTEPTTPASVSTVPTTVVVTTTMPPALLSWSNPYAAASSPPSASIAITPVSFALLSIIATETMMVPTLIQPPKLAEASGPPRKDLQPRDPESNRSFTRMRSRLSFTPAPTVAQSMMATALSAILPTAPVQVDLLPSNNPRRNRGRHPRGFSPTAEQILIVAAGIGAFIIVVTGIFLLLRMKGIDVFGKVRGRKARKGGPQGMYRWRSNSDTPSKVPPQYENGFPAEEKKYTDGNRAEGNFAPSISPAILPPLAIPDTPAILARAESLFMRNPAVYLPQESPITDIQASYNNTGRRNTFLTRQSPDANNTVDTQISFLTRNLSFNSGPANQAAQSRMSYMSSLSSGFGDGLIILNHSNSDPSMQGYRQSRPPGTFSWMQGHVQQPRDRDTVYTTTSEESAPRFRTVNSWVAQQATRVQIPVQNIPVPAIPLPLQTRIQNGQDQAAPLHQRNLSEDPVFKFHPGDEVQISRGSRVPSEILNARIGIDSR